MSETIIGIDLGTTNSEVAVLQSGQVAVIEQEGGSKLLPSVVGLSENNTLLIGQAAKNQSVLYPEKTIASIKRKMGEPTQISLGDEHYSPQAVSALLLKQLKASAEAYLGHSVHQAVITVPAYFSDQQRQATREAGELAGLAVARIINEPTAAALAYHVDHDQERTVLVYDLGGGTFDVSVVAISPGVVEVLASHGNNQLGGDDFDQRLVDYLLEKVMELHKVDLSPSLKAMARLRELAMTTKLHLSDHRFYRIKEAYLMAPSGEPVHLSLEITRDDYETLIQEYIDETLASVHTAINEAHLTVQDMDEILLVGGSTRTPLVMESLAEIFHQSPRGEIHPDLCVAMGAAIQAGTLAGEKASVVLVDVTPYTFGTSAISFLNGELSPYAYIPLIQKNTPLPVTKSEIFHTVHEDQETVEVTVYQGESPDARENNKIGDFRISGLRHVRGHNDIVTQFHLDVNGILRVTAEEKLTGKSNAITIRNAMRMDIEGELAAGKEQLNALFNNGFSSPAAENSPAVDEEKTVARAQEVLKKANARLADVDETDKEDLIDLMESVNDHLTRKNTKDLLESLSELDDMLYYLASSET